MDVKDVMTEEVKKLLELAERCRQRGHIRQRKVYLQYARQIVGEYNLSVTVPSDEEE